MSQIINLLAYSALGALTKVSETATASTDSTRITHVVRTRAVLRQNGTLVTTNTTTQLAWLQLQTRCLGGMRM